VEVPVHCSRLLALAATAALAACADTPASPTAPMVGSPAATPHSARAGETVERPWKGRCAVEAVASGPTQEITGSCQMAHLGRVTVRTVETFTSATTAINESWYTAANGDELHTTGTVTATFGPAPDEVTLVGTWTAAGGTGRFADATGTADYAGAARLTGPTTAVGSYTLEGRLAY
jgi:hypothetical protein